MRREEEEVDADADVEVDGRPRDFSPGPAKESSVWSSPLVEADDEGGDRAGREAEP